MRNFLLLIVFALCSVNAHAELSKHEQHTIDLMLSGNLIELKQAAQKIHASEIFNTAVLDVAAEVLLKNYPNVYKPQVDTFSWLAKAIGHSKNSRYSSAMQEVVENVSNKKVRRYAKVALKKVGAAGDTEQYELGTVGMEVPEYL